MKAKDVKGGVRIAAAAHSSPRASSALLRAQPEQAHTHEHGHTRRVPVMRSQTTMNVGTKNGSAGANNVVSNTSVAERERETAILDRLEALKAMQKQMKIKLDLANKRMSKMRDKEKQTEALHEQEIQTIEVVFKSMRAKDLRVIQQLRQELRRLDAEVKEFRHTHHLHHHHSEHGHNRSRSESSSSIASVPQSHSHSDTNQSLKTSIRRKSSAGNIAVHKQEVNGEGEDDKEPSVPIHIQQVLLVQKQQELQHLRTALVKSEDESNKSANHEIRINIQLVEDEVEDIQSKIEALQKEENGTVTQHQHTIDLLNSTSHYDTEQTELRPSWNEFNSLQREAKDARQQCKALEKKASTLSVRNASLNADLKAARKRIDELEGKRDPIDILARVSSNP